MESAIKKAVAAGVKVVVAAGNAEKGQDYGPDVSTVFPACLPEVITVSGLMQTYATDARTGYGSGVDYVAPCNYIYDAVRKMPESSASTSFATPQIASALALVALDTTHRVSDLNACCLPVQGGGKGIAPLATAPR